MGRGIAKVHREGRRGLTRDEALKRLIRLLRNHITSAKRRADERIVRNFERVASMPPIWQMASEELWCAAEILRERREAVRDVVKAAKEGDPIPREWLLQGAELMLRGFALENSMKGL